MVKSIQSLSISIQDSPESPPWKAPRQPGIPEIIISDNGAQFSAATFSQFTEEWGFTHLTSSPHYPQSNGEADRAVQAAKDLIT